jgi:cytochrome c biogenesis protein CcmG, thiol:disulfide interchange protein DsbE
MSAGQEPARTVERAGLMRFAPIAIFGAIAAVFFIMLTSGRDAQELPSALKGRPAPIFTLPPVEGLTLEGRPVPGFSTADLKKGKVTVVNVFASWCGPCRDEHPQIKALAADRRIAVIGINQKDEPANAIRFLETFGNPYAAVGADSNGRASIDWGVYGVPETFIVRGDGTIAFKKVGPILPEELETLIKPEIEKALK